jgi:hypothetical protein
MGLTEREEKLIEFGNAVVAACGHKIGCYKLSPAIPCNCGLPLHQAQAVANWRELLDQIKEQ